MSDILNQTEWTTFDDPDGITVRLEGADETLVVLWDAVTTTGTIRDMVRGLIRWEEDRDQEDVEWPIVAAFLRRGKALVPVRIDVRPGPRFTMVAVVDPATSKYATVAMAKCPTT